MAQKNLIRSVLVVALGLASVKAAFNSPQTQCTIPATTDGSDDTPAILDAFKTCKSGGRIIFSNVTYHINQVMNTTELLNTEIQIHGTLLWSTNTTYWLSHPQRTGFQNGSAAWFLGGTNVTIDGFGYGTLNGNGQAWYNLVNGQSNYPNRPHALAIWKSNGLVLQNLRFLQSQMWTMAIMHSKDVVVQNSYIRSQSTNGYPARNTDGADTIDSDRVTFRNMYIRNGDDAIAIKGNSTNILVEDSTFDNSLGLAIGSLGQYAGTTERVENVTGRNIFFNGTRYNAYVKTWTGDVVNYPPNGGGGGTGYVKNLTFSDFSFIEGSVTPFYITQCTTFSGGEPDCNSSLMEISDILLSNWTGDTSSSYIANMDCSKDSGGCKNITVKDVNVKKTSSGSAVTAYKCSDVSDTVGFVC